METLTTVREIYKNREQYLGRKVRVGGWVRSIRDSRSFGFLVLHDGTFFETLQIVYDDKLDNFSEISRLNVGAAVIAEGTLVETPQAKQPFEIQAEGIRIEGESAPDYPLQKKRHSLDFLRTIPHLRPRTNTFQAVFRVRSLTAYAIHRFFQERGFVYVHTPLITGSDCEGAGEMVSGNDAGSGAGAPHGGRGCGLFPGFFQKDDQSDGQRPAERRDLCSGVSENLYVRADVPRGKFQYDPPRGGILDD